MSDSWSLWFCVQQNVFPSNPVHRGRQLERQALCKSHYLLAVSNCLTTRLYPSGFISLLHLSKGEAGCQPHLYKLLRQPAVQMATKQSDLTVLPSSLLIYMLTTTNTQRHYKTLLCNLFSTFTPHYPLNATGFKCSLAASTTMKLL